MATSRLVSRSISATVAQLVVDRGGDAAREHVAQRRVVPELLGRRRVEWVQAVSSTVQVGNQGAGVVELVGGTDEQRAGVGLVPKVVEVGGFAVVRVGRARASVRSCRQPVRLRVRRGRRCIRARSPDRPQPAADVVGGGGSVSSMTSWRNSPRLRSRCLRLPSRSPRRRAGGRRTARRACPCGAGRRDTSPRRRAPRGTACRSLPAGRTAGAARRLPTPSPPMRPIIQVNTARRNTGQMISIKTAAPRNRTASTARRRMPTTSRTRSNANLIMSAVRGYGARPARTKA